MKHNLKNMFVLCSLIVRPEKANMQNKMSFSLPDMRDSERVFLGHNLLGADLRIPSSAS